jgi:hypothetical protein
MPLKPGSLDDFAFSMAAAIENELNLSLLADGLPGLPMDASRETRDRRRLFVAIARGVVRHLRDNEGSFVIPYQDGGTNRTTAPDISVTGL